MDTDLYYIFINSDREEIKDVIESDRYDLTLKAFNNDFTVLHLLASRVFNNPKELVDMLIEKGLNIDEPDMMGITPLFHAVMKSNHEMIEALLSHNPNIEITDNQGFDLFFYCVDYNRDFLQRHTILFK